MGKVRAVRSGGTSAPKAAARGHTTGISAARKPVRQGLAPARIAPGPAAPSPGGPSPSAAPKPPTPMPWDAQASNDEANALKKRENAYGSLDSGWLREQQAMGLEGPWADFATNPYSQASLLQRSYDNANRGTQNSYAAQGQLYAGSNINAHGANTHDFQLGRNQLEQTRNTDYANYQKERLGAGDAYNESISEAGWNRIQAGLEAEPEPEYAPAEGGGGGQGGGGGGGKKAGAKKKKAQSKGQGNSQPKRQQQIKANISKGKKAR